MMYPFQFDYLWVLQQYGPMTAAELAERRAHRIITQTPSQVAGSLQPLVKRGFVIAAVGRGPNIYGLSDKGREYVDA